MLINISLATFSVNSIITLSLRCENLNREYNEISIADIEDLIEGLYQQGKDYLQRVKEFKDSAEGVA